MSGRESKHESAYNREVTNGRMEHKGEGHVLLVSFIRILKQDDISMTALRARCESRKAYKTSNFMVSMLRKKSFFSFH